MRDLMQYIVRELRKFFRERWTQETDLDRSMRYTAESCRSGTVGVDLQQEHAYLMSRHGKDFWGLSGEEVLTAETAPGRCKNRLKRLKIQQIAKDCLWGLLTLAAVITAWSVIFGE